MVGVIPRLGVVAIGVGDVAAGLQVAPGVIAVSGKEMAGGVEALCYVALRIEEVLDLLIALHVVAREQTGGAVGIIAGDRTGGVHLR